jgi:hypothetical protein
MGVYIVIKRSEFYVSVDVVQGIFTDLSLVKDLDGETHFIDFDVDPAIDYVYLVFSETAFAGILIHEPFVISQDKDKIEKEISELAKRETQNCYFQSDWYYVCVPLNTIGAYYL